MTWKVDGSSRAGRWEIPRFEDELRRLAPDIEDAADGVMFAQWLSFPSIASGELGRAARLIFTLAISDLADLLHDSVRGSGRAAMRSSRSLVEHLVNLGTVVESDESGERYMRHLDLGPQLMSKSDHTLIFLDKRRRAVAEHELSKAAREASVSWEEALALYGPGFALKWHPDSLRARAERQGVPFMYDAYRIASNVAHGSAAGSFGHFHVTPEGVGSFFAGQTPALVPFALAVGTHAYANVLHLLERHTAIDLSTGKESVSEFLRKHYDAIWDVSRDISQAQMKRADAYAVGARSYLAFSRGGRRRWYTTLPTDFAPPPLWYRAHESGVTQRLEEVMEGLVRTYSDDFGVFSEGGWAAIELTNQGLNVDFQHPPIPAGAIFPRLVKSEPDSPHWAVAVALDAEGHLVYDGTVLKAGEEDPPD